jgi:hypothetical protein
MPIATGVKTKTVKKRTYLSDMEAFLSELRTYEFILDKPTPVADLIK